MLLTASGQAKETTRAKFVRMGDMGLRGNFARIYYILLVTVFELDIFYFQFSGLHIYCWLVNPVVCEFIL